MSTTRPVRSLGRSAGLLGGMTLVSRVLGFVRDILIASIFGTSAAAEAFVVSFKLPNLLRDLVGEGAMNAAIVPVLTETRLAQGEREFWRLVWTLALWILAVLAVIAAAGSLGAEWVVRIVAPGFSEDPEKFRQTVMLTRIVFPFVFLVGVSAYLMGVLHTMRIFGPSALSPIILNISIIVFMVQFAPRWGAEAVAWGILTGGVVSVAVQLAFFLRTGVVWVRVRIFHEGVKKILSLLGPRFWGSAVYQTSVFVDTILASFFWIVGDGGQSALYYSSRLFQLPLAIFGVSMAQAVLPELSAHASGKDPEAFRKSLRFALRHVIFLAVPAAAGLAVLSRPMVELLFKRGQSADFQMPHEDKVQNHV
ncbi:MAG: murein biosynthesis integral membrane protein MurJ, partial [Candidatus Omnitrophica bacterium]|nr:murein biosynthesis integral membrane protein MurJ [Candidatus Omnitrophota bacterium]